MSVEYPRDSSRPPECSVHSITIAHTSQEICERDWIHGLVPLHVRCYTPHADVGTSIPPEHNMHVIYSRSIITCHVYTTLVRESPDYLDTARDTMNNSWLNVTHYHVSLATLSNVFSRISRAFPDLLMCIQLVFPHILPSVLYRVSLR